MQIHSLRNALTHRELQLYTKTGVREPPNNSKTEITKTQGKNSKRCAQNAAIHIGSHLNNIHSGSDIKATQRIASSTPLPGTNTITLQSAAVHARTFKSHCLTNAKYQAAQQKHKQRIA